MRTVRTTRSSLTGKVEVDLYISTCKGLRHIKRKSLGVQVKLQATASGLAATAFCQHFRPRPLVDVVQPLTTADNNKMQGNFHHARDCDDSV
jgi:hypothetical protein